MTAHAPRPPSSAWIWSKCTAQPYMLHMIEPIPQDDTASREGGAAHWAGAELIAGRQVGHGQITPDGTVLAEDMIESAEMWSEHVRGILERATTRATPDTHGVEQLVRADGAISPEVYGTPDFWLHDVNAGILHVSDLKHGHGVVEVFENWQLICYAILICASRGITAGTRVSMTVVQPRAYHREGPVRNWTVTVADLVPFAAVLRAAAAAADPACVVGSHCKHCEARHGCTAYQQDAYRIAEMTQRPIPHELSPTALGLELTMLTDAAARLKARISGLEAQGEHLARNGSPVPGWTFEAGKTDLKWIAPREQVVMLGQLVGRDLSKPADVITPTQAIKAGLPAELVAKYAERPKGALKFVRADETLGRRVFTAS